MPWEPLVGHCGMQVLDVGSELTGLFLGAPELEVPGIEAVQAKSGFAHWPSVAFIRKTQCPARSVERQVQIVTL